MMQTDLRTLTSLALVNRHGVTDLVGSSSLSVTRYLLRRKRLRGGVSRCSITQCISVVLPYPAGGGGGGAGW